MRKLQIGDEVLVKSTLENGECYGEYYGGFKCYFDIGMEKYKGELATVISMPYEDRYKLEFHKEIAPYYFTEDMLIKCNYGYVKSFEAKPCFKLSLNSIDILFVKTDEGFIITTEGDVLEYKEVDNRTMECLEEFIYTNIEGEFK